MKIRSWILWARPRQSSTIHETGSQVLCLAALHLATPTEFIRMQINAIVIGSRDWSAQSQPTLPTSDRAYPKCVHDFEVIGQLSKRWLELSALLS